MYEFEGWSASQIRLFLYSVHAVPLLPFLIRLSVSCHTALLSLVLPEDFIMCSFIPLILFETYRGFTKYFLTVHYVSVD